MHALNKPTPNRHDRRRFLSLARRRKYAQLAAEFGLEAGLRLRANIEQLDRHSRRTLGGVRRPYSLAACGVAR